MSNFEINSLTYILIALLLLLIVAVSVLLFKFKYSKKEQSIKLVENSSELSDSTSGGCPENVYKLLPDPIVILNPEKKIIYLNLAAEKMLACKLRRVMGKEYSSIFTLLNIKTRRILQGIFSSENIHNQELVARECLLQTEVNQTFSIELNIVPLRITEEGDEDHIILVLRDITERKALQSKLSDLGKYDSLTRMLNRKSFEVEVKRLIDNAHKHNSTHVLAYFSIDQYQVMHDTIGYSGGESLVLSMVEQINNHLVKSLDIVGRVSANEFAVVFCERKLTSAIKTIEEILHDVANYQFMSRGQQYAVSMSSGFIVIDNETTSSTRAISEANSACNLANKRGGNSLSAYHEDANDTQKSEGNLEWVMILKTAMQENRFRMHAQPIHLLEQGQYKKPFSHYELLIRLSDENGNQISPDEFISAAEYYSMMPALDRWVIRNVLKQIKKIPEQTPLPVFAINLSGQSLNDPTFLDFVLKEIKTVGVHPQMLCFEITEQVAVEELSVINKFISKLKALGCTFSLDDFGTGVSSYSYLRSLNVDYLKIDGSFVKNIADDEVAKTMVQSINQIGHTMNLKVIAEYVENEQIINLLREMGVDYGQGYAIARPGPLEAVIRRHQANSTYA